MNRRKLHLIILVVYLAFLALGPKNIYAQEYQKQEILEFELQYQNEKVSLNSVTKKQGFSPDSRVQPERGYVMQILDKSSQELTKVVFNFPLQEIREDFSNPNEPTSSIENLTESTAVITIPIFENAHKMIILNPQGQQILENDLSAILDPNFTNSNTFATQKTPSFKFTPINILGLVFLIAIAVGGLWLYRKHRQDEWIPDQVRNDNIRNQNDKGDGIKQ